MYLRKRGKKWYYTIEVPTEDGQGRQRVERVGGTSYAQAAKAYRQAMKALDEDGSCRKSRKSRSWLFCGTGWKRMCASI